LPEYYVSLVGWPVEADSPEEAAKSFYRMLLEAHHAGGMSPVLEVTDKEVKLDLLGTTWKKSHWTFDCEKWWEEFTNV
jgi:hypothetical protein